MLDESKLKYTESHEWAFVEGDTAIIGITNHAQEELGDIVYVEVKEIGTKINQFDELGSIESVKAVSEIKSPLSGEVTDINSLLEKEPEIVNKEPYGNGWVAKIKISNTSEFNKLMDYNKYMEFIKNN